MGILDTRSGDVKGKVHKIMDVKKLPGKDNIECGLNLTRYVFVSIWDNVTCKNCLKHRPEKTELDLYDVNNVVSLCNDLEGKLARLGIFQKHTVSIKELVGR